MHLSHLTKKMHCASLCAFNNLATCINRICQTFTAQEEKRDPKSQIIISRSSCADVCGYRNPKTDYNVGYLGTMRYKSTTSWKLNHICLGGPVEFACHLTSLHCTRRMGASGNCACASSRSLSASSAPAFHTGPSTTQNMGVLEMPLL